MRPVRPAKICGGWRMGLVAFSRICALSVMVILVLGLWGYSFGQETKVEIGGEFRYRLELRDNFNFNKASYEDDAVNLFRSRIHANLTHGPYLRLFAEAQDSESFAKSGLQKTASFVNRFDLYQLYGEFKSPFDAIPLTATVGRQTLLYGDDRFISFASDTWSNVSSLIDAVKLVSKPTSWFQADLFYGQPVKVERVRADSADHSDNLYGFYTSLVPFKGHLLDTFLFIRHNLNNEIAGERSGEFGQLKEYTVGNRFKGKTGDLDYGLEWAMQFGSRAHDNIQAWAWHNETGYTFSKLSGTPRIDFEYNFGSGDSDPTDGTFETFDNLFPGNHKHYGFIDFVSLRNIHDLKLGLQIKPHSKLKLSADTHWFFLDTNGSAWFNGQGTGTIRAAKAGASTTVGQEIDLLAKWQVNEKVGVWIGYSHFFTGAFVKDTGSHDDANFFYAQTMVKF